MESVRLRVKDVDFERREVLIRDGKGAKDRVTMLSGSLVASLPLEGTLDLPHAAARFDHHRRLLILHSRHKMRGLGTYPCTFIARTTASAIASTSGLSGLARGCWSALNISD